MVCKSCNKLIKKADKNFLVISNKIITESKIKPQKCPKCKSKVIRKASLSYNKHNKYYCKNCNEIWDFEVKQKNNFKRENTLEEIVGYLKNQERNNVPLKFWYRDDIEPREMHDYLIDEKYVRVRSDKGYYIKFLINKIRKI
ncbi:MAG: hypothetical protein WD607_02710 [Candidatus Paceibacterota bacterium]